MLSFHPSTNVARDRGLSKLVGPRLDWYIGAYVEAVSTKTRRLTKSLLLRFYLAVKYFQPLWTIARLEPLATNYACYRFGCFDLGIHELLLLLVINSVQTFVLNEIDTPCQFECVLN